MFTPENVVVDWTPLQNPIRQLLFEFLVRARIKNELNITLGLYSFH